MSFETFMRPCSECDDRFATLNRNGCASCFAQLPVHLRTEGCIYSQITSKPAFADALSLFASLQLPLRGPRKRRTQRCLGEEQDCHTIFRHTRACTVPPVPLSNIHPVSTSPILPFSPEDGLDRRATPNAPVNVPSCDICYRSIGSCATSVHVVDEFITVLGCHLARSSRCAIQRQLPICHRSLFAVVGRSSDRVFSSGQACTACFALRWSSGFAPAYTSMPTTIVEDTPMVSSLAAAQLRYST
ncbi:hypothetical protein PENSPDRAFT_231087 [Peniophora sp. CONT]|nr:hypothetical protein PENSPDRAFT_231087 [Peniophora sp. CONT]